MLNIDNLIVTKKNRRKDIQREKCYKFEFEIRKKFPKIRLQKKIFKSKSDASLLANDIAQKEIKNIHFYMLSLYRHQADLYQGLGTNYAIFPEIIIVDYKRRKGNYACVEHSCFQSSDIINKKGGRELQDKKTYEMDLKEFREEFEFKGKATNENLKKFINDEVDEMVHPTYWLQGTSLENEPPYLSKNKKDVIIPYRAYYVGIYIPSKLHNLHTLLHEVAHLLSPTGEGHNEKFMGVLIYLYNKYLKIDKKILRKIATKYDLKFLNSHNY